jgi:phage-related protein
MAEELGKMRIAINLDGSDMEKGIGQVLKSLKTANEAFKANEAGVDKYNLTLKDLQNRHSDLSKIMTAQSDVVKKLKTDLNAAKDAQTASAKELERVKSAYAANSEEVKKAQKAYDDNIAATQKAEQAYIKNVAALNKTQVQMERTNEEIKNFGKNQKKAEEGSNSFAESMKKVAATIAAAFAVDKIIDFGKNLIEQSSKISALNSQYTQVMGGMKDQTDKYLDQMASKWNKHPNDLKSAFTQYYAILKGKGLSEADAYKTAQAYLERTVDANAFANEEMGSTTERFMGMIKGEYDSVDTAMVNVNQTMLNDKAQQVYKKKWDELTVTQQENLKVSVALQQHMSSGVFGQGEREAGSYENTVANLRGTWNQLLADFGSPIMGVLTNAFKGLSEWLKKVDVKAVQKGFSDFASYIASVVTPIIDGIKSAFTQFFTILQNIGVIDALKAAWDGIVIGFKWFVDNLPGIAGGIGQFLSDWSPVVDGILAGVAAFGAIKLAILAWSAVTKIATAVQIALNIAMSLNPIGIIIIAIGALVAAGVYLYTHWGELKDKALSIFGALGDWFRNVFGAIGQFFSDLWSGIVNVATTVWNFLVSAVMAIVQPFIDLIRNLFSGLSSGISAIFTGLKDFFVGIWDLIKNVILGPVLLIFDLVTGHFSELKDHAIQIFNNIKDAIASIFSGIYNVISGIVSTIVTFVSNLFSSLWNGITSIFNVIKNTIISVWESIKSTVSNLASSIWNSVTGAFHNMVDGISGAMSSVWDTVTGIWDKITGFFSNFSLVDIGTNIMKGLGQGIENAWDWIKSKLDWIAKLVPDWLKSALG